MSAIPPDKNNYCCSEHQEGRLKLYSSLSTPTKQEHAGVYQCQSAFGSLYYITTDHRKKEMYLYF